jgi:hypothetical protein
VTMDGLLDLLVVQAPRAHKRSRWAVVCAWALAIKNACSPVNHPVGSSSAVPLFNLRITGGASISPEIFGVFWSRCGAAPDQLPIPRVTALKKHKMIVDPSTRAAT